MRKRDEVKQVVLDVLEEITEVAELPLLDEQTNVVKDLGLDTNDGLDLACLLEIRLGCAIPHNINPLFNDCKRKGAHGFERTVGDIIDLICELPDKEVESA